METTVDLTTEWMRPVEAAKLIGVSRQRIHTLVRDGVLRSAKLDGRSMLIHRGDTEKRREELAETYRRRHISCQGKSGEVHELTPENSYITGVGKDGRPVFRCKPCARWYQGPRQRDYQRRRRARARESRSAAEVA